MPTPYGGKWISELASSSTRILSVPALTRSIDGLLVGAMHDALKPPADLTFGTSEYGISRASETFALPQLGRSATDNIKLLPASIYLFSIEVK